MTWTLGLKRFESCLLFFFICNLNDNLFAFFLSVCEERDNSGLWKGLECRVWRGTHWSEKLEEDVVGETLESAQQTASRP